MPYPLVKNVMQRGCYVPVKMAIFGAVETIKARIP
jgi:hypothetical protein